MSVFESIERHPVEYLPTGDKALLVTWAVLTDPDRPEHRALAAVLCLEDGRAVIAETNEFKFDYRYDNARQVWVDVSKIPEGHEEGPDADTDQEAEDHGGAEVPG